MSSAPVLHHKDWPHNIPHKPRVREPDPAVVEGVNSVIYAAPRTELRGTPRIVILLERLTNPLTELHILRDLLMHKYGREYSAGVMENRDTCVTDRVRSGAFSIPRPSGEEADDSSHSL